LIIVAISFAAGILSQYVPNTKIQLKGQLAVRRDGIDPLPLQIVRQLQQAIDAGRVIQGTQLPSTRSLARSLGVSRNTVLVAYEELASRGIVSSRPGAGMYVRVPAPLSAFDVKAVMHEAQYPARTIALRDPEGNELTISY
jgi:DNA-binding transcriptional regulator YhcF (GntR family)